MEGVRAAAAAAAREERESVLLSASSSPRSLFFLHFLLLCSFLWLSVSLVTHAESTGKATVKNKGNRCFGFRGREGKHASVLYLLCPTRLSFSLHSLSVVVRSKDLALANARSLSKECWICRKRIIRKN